VSAALWVSVIDVVARKAEPLLRAQLTLHHSLGRAAEVTEGGLELLHLGLRVMVAWRRRMSGRS
jgi:hypothetical protein